MACSKYQEKTREYTKFGTKSETIIYKLIVKIGVRAGGVGARGAAVPPKFWATQIFWAARENLGNSVFKTSPYLFNYFEDLNINLKSA